MVITVLKLIVLTLTGIKTASIPVLPLSDEADNCNQYETVHGINYTLVTYPGSNRSCDSECLYSKDDRRQYPGNMCMHDVEEKLTRKETIGGQIKGCPKRSPLILNNRVVAGYIYMGKGHEIAALACNGRKIVRFEKTMDKSSSCFPFGSIIVNPGCTLQFLWQTFKIEGTIWDKFTSGIHSMPIHFPSGKPQPCILQAVWTCTQSFPDCTPSDSWNLVTEIDNRKSDVPTEYSYKKTIGTKFSTEMKTSFGTSTTFEAEAKATFFKMFETTLGVKSTTKYDWSRIDAETRSESVTVTVTHAVPAGKMFKIEQAVGTCGENTVQTKSFRITDY